MEEKMDNKKIITLGLLVIFAVLVLLVFLQQSGKF